jgi:hypothetical protein
MIVGTPERISSLGRVVVVVVVVGSEPGPYKERRVSLTAEEHLSRNCPFSAEGYASGPSCLDRPLAVLQRTLPYVDSRLALALWSSRACVRQSRESRCPIDGGP